MQTNNPHIHTHKHGLSQPFPLALPPSLPHWDSEGSSRPGGWSCWQRQVVPEDFRPPAGQPQLSEEENGTSVVKKGMGPQQMSPWPFTFSLHRLRHGLGLGRVEGWGFYFLGLEPLTWLLIPPGFLRFQEESEHSQSTRAGGRMLSWWDGQLFTHLRPLCIPSKLQACLVRSQVCPQLLDRLVWNPGWGICWGGFPAHKLLKAPGQGTSPPWVSAFLLWNGENETHILQRHTEILLNQKEVVYWIGSSNISEEKSLGGSI